MSPRSADPLTLEHALLGFVRAEPRHGYDIYRELSDPEGLWMIWRIKQSRLYALLAKLEERGYLTASIEPQEGKPPRKVYALTPAGRDAFLSWVQAPVPHGRQVRLDFLAKLFFAQRAGEEIARLLIDRQRQVCRDWLEEQHTQGEAARAQSFQQLVHRYRAGQIQAMLDWLDGCADTLVATSVAE